jgi:hypothetical protein
MGVNHGSAVSLRIKRQPKIMAKSLDLKRYNNFFAETRLLGSKRLSAGMTEHGDRSGQRPPCHHTARDSRSGSDTALELKLQFVRVIVTTEL